MAFKMELRENYKGNTYVIVNYEHILNQGGRGKLLKINMRIASDSEKQ